ncbi:hypothetical protein ONZ45_g9808 [Pleurotus djamor]|nr:hypothetical protein ONZ45_g9808 [Pleurotus djamor]
MTFPPEIWLQIIWHLANNSHRASLHPLLLVSRSMYELALPLMYKTISKPPRTHSSKASSTWIELLAAQVNNRLDYTEELTLNFGGNPSNHGVRDRAASKIVAAMPNLKKLRIHVWFPAATLKSIHPTAKLTHLSCSVPLGSKILLDLVISQPTLELLALASGSDIASDLPPHALPRLHTFISDSELWEPFVKGRAVEHLSGYLPRRYTFQDPQEMLRNIRTLSVECGDQRSFQNIAPFLKSIECLTIKVPNTSIDGTISLRNVFLIPSLLIPSENLRYFSIGEQDVSDPTAYATAMFSKFPSLRTVDHIWDISLINDYSSELFRLKRGSVLLRPSLRMVFPPEIWLQILHDLTATSHRASLHPLLLVSRRMHGLAIPLMYEDIRKPPQGSSEKRPANSPTWVERLAAQSNQHLHLTEELQLSFPNISNISPACVRAARKAVSAMPNLKRLRMHIALHVDVILKALSPNATLTHLSCLGQIRMRTLLALLDSQHCLQILALESGVRDSDRTITPLMQLPPTLHTFIGDCESRNLFNGGIKLEHLSIQIDLTPDFRDPSGTFRNLRSLLIQYASIVDMTDLAPFLESIESISLSVLWDRCVRLGSPFKHEDISSIPSTKLTYFAVVEDVILNHDTHAAAMFSLFPSLKIIDHTKNTRSRSSLKATRYIRDAQKPVEIILPQLRPWEAWWEVYPKL